MTFEHNGHAGTIEPDDGVFISRVVGLHDFATFEGSSFTEAEVAFRGAAEGCSRNP